LFNKYSPLVCFENVQFLEPIWPAYRNEVLHSKDNHDAKKACGDSHLKTVDKTSHEFRRRLFFFKTAAQDEYEAREEHSNPDELLPV